MKTRLCIQALCAGKALASFACMLAVVFAFSYAITARAEGSSPAVAKNVETGITYDSLAAAFDAASDGQSIALVSDYSIDSPISFSKAITLDLAGNSLTIDAGAAASSANNAALKYTGSGSARFVDSASGGGVNITVGASPEQDNTLYQGILLAGAGSLSVENCGLVISYAGTDTLANTPFPELRGISVQSGSLALTGASSLAVRAAAQDYAFGANVVSGIYVEEGAGSLSVGEDACISVDNNARPVERISSGEADLVQVSIDDGSDLYSEMQEAFYEKAKFDSKNDKPGLMYGSQVYYSTDLPLSNGAVIRAFSDPVSSELTGRKDAIKAKYLFVSARRTERPQKAYGIASSQGFSSSVVQAGNVSVAVNRGDAYAIYRTESGDWTLNEGNLGAVGKAEYYFSYLDEQFDLAQFADFSQSFDKNLSYISSNNPDTFLLRSFRTFARNIAVIGQEGDARVDGAIDLTSQIDSSHVPDVHVIFSNLHNTDGSSAENQSATIPFGATLGSAGASLPSAADYESGGSRFHFIGWKNSRMATQYTYDSSYLHDELAFDADMNGSATGEVVMDAVYVEVPAGKTFIGFKVDYAVYGYAIDTGSVPSYAACMKSSDSSAQPSAIDTQTGYTYTYAGWADQNGSNVYEGDLPAAYSDAMYTAKFDVSPTLIRLLLYYMISTPNGYLYSNSTDSKVDWTQDAIELANSHVRIGDSYVDEGVEHAFLGWSTRISDVEAMYTDTLPLSFSGSMNQASLSRYGIYSNKDKLVDIDFYVDGVLYSSVMGVSANKTINAAFADSSNASTPVKDGDTFKGWNTSPDATNYLLGNVKTVGSLIEDGSSHVDLHAIWESQIIPDYVTVRFFDEDRETLLLALEMPAGMTVQEWYDEDYKAPDKDGKVFLGWVDADGVRFLPSSTTVVGNVDVYAYYRTESAGSGGLASSGIRSSTNAASASTRSAAATRNNAAAATAAAASADNDKSGPSGQSTSANDYDEASDGQGSTADESTGNIVGLILVILAILAVIAMLVKWLVGRNRTGGDAADTSVVAPEMEAIRF